MNALERESIDSALQQLSKAEQEMYILNETLKLMPEGEKRDKGFEGEKHYEKR